MGERRLRFVEGKSSKFWHASVDGKTLRVQFGRIGTVGQAQDKEHASEAEAKKTFDKLVAEKLKKGYVDDEGTPTSAPPTSAPSTSAPAAKAVAKQATAKVRKATLDSEPAPEAESGAASAPVAESVAAPPPVAAQGAAPVAAAGLSKPFVRPPVRLLPTPAAPPELVGAPPAPRPRPPIVLFDAKVAAARVAKLGDRSLPRYRIPWDKLDVDLSLSREEAWLLLELFSSKIGATLGDLIDSISRLTPQEPERGLTLSCGVSAVCVRVYFSAFGPEGLVDVLCNAHHQHLWPGFEEQVRGEIVPFLSEEERSRIRRQVYGSAAPSLVAVSLLGLLGEPPDELRGLVAAWPDGSAPEVAWWASTHPALTVLARLGDAEVFAREAVRLGAVPKGGDDVRLILKASGLRCLELIRTAIVGAHAKDIAESMARALAAVEAPECAPVMLDVLRESRAPQVGRAWLDAHPEFGAEGLVALVIGQGARSDAARTYFETLRKRGLDGCIEAALATLPEPQRSATRARLDAESSTDVEPPVVNEGALPLWVERCFGDPAKLVMEPVELSDDELRPVPHVQLGASAAARVPPPLPPVEPLEAPAPFDLEASLTALLGHHRSNTYGTQTWHYWSLHALRTSLPMGREEAQFWLQAAQFVRDDTDAAEVEAMLRVARAGGEAKRAKVGAYSFTLVPSFVLYGFEGLLEHLANVQDVVDRVVRYLDASERVRLRDFLLAASDRTAGRLLLAQRLGATRAQLAAAVRQVTVLDRDQLQPFFALLGVLDDPEEIVASATSLKVMPWNEATAREWLRLTGLHGVDVLEAAVHASGAKGPMLRALATVATPGLVAAMLRYRMSSRTKIIARQWLDANVVLAIDGLLPHVGTKSKLASPAVDYLRELRRRGYGPIIAARAGGSAAVTSQVLDVPAGLARPTKDDVALAPVLPGIRLATPEGTRRLSGEHVATVLAELRSSTLDVPTTRIAMLREHADRRSLDRFAWALFQTFLADGGPSKDRWKLEAIGHLGGDASAIELAKLVRTWPGEAQHQRAVVGLDCLRAIGSDTALMQIHGIAQKVSFKGIKERAGECLDAIANDRGLSRDELADRIIPDGGLDARGGRTFDFGPRQFFFVLSSELKPMVRDAAGKRSSDLPKPGAKDDAERATDAVAAWKLLKKQVAEVAKTQAQRLEHAMVVGRRWTPMEFDALFLAHPLMIHLVRRLIWACYGADGRPVGSFRVGEDSALADPSDTPFTLPDDATHVGVVHPSHLTEAERQAWGEQLTDYELVPPFVQLGRVTYALTDKERHATTLARFSAHDVDPKTLVFGLEAQGWQRGQPQDGGSFCVHHKVFGDVTAVLTYRDGCWAGTPGDDWPRQTIEALGFLTDPEPAKDGFFSFTQGVEALKLSDVDTVIVSEAISEVSKLYERGAPG